MRPPQTYAIGFGTEEELLVVALMQKFSQGELAHCVPDHNVLLRGYDRAFKVYLNRVASKAIIDGSDFEMFVHEELSNLIGKEKLKEAHLVVGYRYTFTTPRVFYITIRISKEIHELEKRIPYWMGQIIAKYLGFL